MLEVSQACITVYHVTTTSPRSTIIEIKVLDQITVYRRSNIFLCFKTRGLHGSREFKTLFLMALNLNLNQDITAFQRRTVKILKTFLRFYFKNLIRIFEFISV